MYLQDSSYSSYSHNPRELVCGIFLLESLECISRISFNMHEIMNMNDLYGRIASAYVCNVRIYVELS